LTALNSSREFDLDYEVIPRICSVQALAARHRIALNRIGEPLTIMTRRQLAEGFPNTSGNLAVMLDSRSAFREVKEDVDIYWGPRRHRR